MTVTPLKSIAPKLPDGILYGGDYNPEQWPEEVWLEDARLMRETGVNLVSVAIFAWAKLEPRPGVFTFEWLDRIIDLLWKHEVSVCLATATASPPAWFSHAHPESLPVDENGVRMSIGSRQHYCPNSRAYREASAKLCKKLADRYAAHPAVALWHVNNEVGCHSHTCYCDTCASEFRTWLKNRYTTIDALNDSWGTAFWSQAYGEWDEIMPPRKMPTFRNPGQTLDYSRFMSDSMRDIVVGEVAALRSVAPDAKVTTNGMNFHRPTDYQEWFKYVDIASWDSYPDPALGSSEICTAAFNHDLFRCVRGGQPFILMEQVTSQVNWRPTNVLKAPGQMRALSYQAVARGADGVMFFQWRAAKAGAEKFHGAMVPHFGIEGSRVHAEVRELGAELKKLRPLLGARTQARVALIVSWANRWALELESKPMQFDYTRIVLAFYRVLWELNIAVDIVHPNQSLACYDVVVAPALYQLSKNQSESLRSFVSDGGTLVMSYFSGVADERDHIWLGGYPALLQDVLGLAVEEWQPLMPDANQALQIAGEPTAISCSEMCELVQLRGATALATYANDFYAGRAALTTHAFGQGHAHYLATLPAHDYLLRWFRNILDSIKTTAPLPTPEGVEATVRVGASEEFLFVINHEAKAATINFSAWSGRDLITGESCTGVSTLPPFGVRIVSRPIQPVGKRT